ncbi:pilus assembly PilX family protein [Niveibacterium terrae]|uniref:pilus assembly PilX family protein n=1 Tax=Niveibacterium terrae TaxID=3373598 RepID=UPI003A92A6BC
MKTPKLRSRQRGVTLVIAMIMLILVSMLAAAAYLMSTGEARAASGWSDRQRAIFLAENALKTAESSVATLVAGQPDVANLIKNKGTGYYVRSNTAKPVPAFDPWPEDSSIGVTTTIDGRTASAHYIVIFEGNAPAFGEQLAGTPASSKRSRFTLVAQAGGLKPDTNVVLSVSREY